MRSLAFVLVISFLACGAPALLVDQPLPDAPTEIDGSTPPVPAFQLISPTVDIPDKQDITYCYYFRTSNTSELAIQRWASHMTAAAHDMVLYLTQNDLMPPGTQTPTRCGTANTTSPLWTYSAQTADAEAQLPADDGAGNPIGQLIKANQSGFLQIHYVNTTGAVVHAHVELDAYAYDDAAHPTLAGPFVTSRQKFQIDPGSTANPATGMVYGSCPVPLDGGKPVTFFRMTTHTYKQGVHTFINDGTTRVFDSTSWAQPGATSWSAPPFYTFKGDTLTYQCEYLNPNTYTIVTGDNPATDELCMSISFYFPANRDAIGHYCLDSATVY